MEWIKNGVVFCKASLGKRPRAFLYDKKFAMCILIWFKASVSGAAKTLDFIMTVTKSSLIL